ncbi:H(+)/Cl(-) exchange transporter 7 [Holothuria leucospilota]|uniref:Chloride channel protein n=1 Tax=Holothuria leucospilota TaxID=206669 RepID=A0A9Q1H6B6_HOLLE|nr:H(+)/Cl(-) exchange transporter 7 [Holothuria leucospilota]
MERAHENTSLLSGRVVQGNHYTEEAGKGIRRRNAGVAVHRPSNEEFEPTEVLSDKYQSSDYDVIENQLYCEEEQQLAQKKIHSYIWQLEVKRWFVMLLIGMITACIAAVVDICIDKLAGSKYSLVALYFEDRTDNMTILIPFFLWMSIDIALVSVASLLVVYGEPVAAGSGIPQIKCYLNGVLVPHVVRVKTLVCKVVGIVFAVSGGLAVGKEGPMIHAGSVVAAGVSQGKSTSFKKDFKVFKNFRTDHEKRDFVSGGAAAGVAAAFGAPIGGVLFSLEEGASFWNQSLTWRIFFASMTCSFTLNVLLSYYNGNPWSLSSPGLINFGEFTGIGYHGYEILLFLLMGVFGGLAGALFNAINYKLSVFRIKYVYKSVLCILEVIVISILTVSLSFLSIYLSNDCQPITDSVQYPLQLFCGDGEYSASAALFFSTPEQSVKTLFHAHEGSIKPTTLIPFCLIYFMLATLTYGLSIPSGLFIPSLLAGAAWGRLFGIFLHYLSPDLFSDTGLYALIGAAAQLGGVIRMTISLTVILMEATHNITYGLPLMLVLITAKWCGDIFNHGLYDIHIELHSVPLLKWGPPPLSSHVKAGDVMSRPVITLNTIESVGKITEILQQNEHNGFPVIDPYDQSGMHGGTFRGLIIRSQLSVLLKNKAFTSWPTSTAPRRRIELDDFRNEYPRFTEIEDISITDREKECSIDLRPFMNPSPYSVSKEASLPRIFRLFRALGLRHLVVTDGHNRVIGMVTRKDLARFRYSSHRERGLQELPVVSI